MNKNSLAGKANAKKAFWRRKKKKKLTATIRISFQGQGIKLNNIKLTAQI